MCQFSTWWSLSLVPFRYRGMRFLCVTKLTFSTSVLTCNTCCHCFSQFSVSRVCIFDAVHSSWHLPVEPGWGRLLECSGVSYWHFWKVTKCALALWSWLHINIFSYCAKNHICLLNILQLQKASPPDLSWAWPQTPIVYLQSCICCIISSTSTLYPLGWVLEHQTIWEIAVVELPTSLVYMLKVGGPAAMGNGAIQHLSLGHISLPISDL